MLNLGVWSLTGIVVGVLVVALLVLMIIGCVLSKREIPGIPPGPSFLPLVGNVIDMSWKYRTRKYKYFEKMEKKYGSVYRLYFGRQLLIFLNDMDSVKEAFVIKRYLYRQTHGEVLGGSPAFLIEASHGEGPLTPINMLPQLLYLPGARGKFKKLIAGAELTKTYISKRIVEHKKTWNKDKPRDLIDCGLAAIADADSQEFNNRILMYIFFDMFIAGSDTIANSMDWAFLHMIVNTDTQIKCQKEIDEVVGSERRVVWADKPNMPYCTATLMECLRYSNVAMTSLPHTATKDTMIKGFVIPKGSIILAGINSIHHDENLWEKPEQFKPERFIDGDGKIIHNEKDQRLI
ncbi:hypothetical protein LOTGIDRAFT_163010 [Lottia gigantea]|uniref:Uncharacterized protein n=1 Tax=Lottia gigantea TaxID=225164 RepID=V4BSM8_LOTGI|nr:hypothetical protein LOTGIDRAFT_163010 [Lottia gigantea]ESO92004.1 hypothetical protein LOTGIDRAFT_163010 [Lottia gigantea]